jgi:hypothetical protein
MSNTLAVKLTPWVGRGCMRTVKYILGVAAFTVSQLMSQVASQVASAANLTSIQGPVQLSRAGGPFQPLSAPTQVNPGDVVRADAGGSAQVVFANGATAAVSSNTMYLVSADPSAVLTGAAYQGAPGAAGTAGTAGASVATTAAIVVGASVAVVGGIVYANKKSASP